MATSLSFLKQAEADRSRFLSSRSLAGVRTERDANKVLLAKGINPSAQRKLDRSAARIASSNTFSIVSEELIEKFRLEGDDPKTLKKKEMAAGADQLALISSDLGDPLTSPVGAM